MYIPKVSELNQKENQKLLMPVMLQKLNISIIKGGCSGKADIEQRVKKFHKFTKEYVDIFKSSKMDMGNSGSKDITTLLKPKYDEQVKAVERTIKMPKGVWKEIIHYVSYGKGIPIWEVRYAGFEPQFSKAIKLVTTSISSFYVP